MLPHARPAAVEAAGRVSFFFDGIFTFLPFFLPSLLRSVVSMGFRRSGLEPRDLVLPEELEFTRSAGAPAADKFAGPASSYSGGDS
jgi:hypothetical protein